MSSLPRKDYTVYSFLLAVLVIGMLLLLGLVPSFKIGGLRIKEINILSDICEPEPEQVDSLQEYADTAFTAEALATTPESIEQALSTPSGTSQSWEISPQGIIATPKTAVPRTGVQPAGPDVPGTISASSVVLGSQAATPQGRVDQQGYGAPATLIEDFGAGDMNRFYYALANRDARRPVRIAVLGDSFIEADILTVDMREQLQLLYGGMGPGFVPFSSPLAKYRASVRHTFANWESYNVIKKNSAPAAAKDKFYFSGLVCVPSEGAWTRIEGTNFRRNLSRSSVARLVFINERNSAIDVTVNDTIQSRFTPESSPLVQQINLYGDIASIKVAISSPAGFTGYGVVLESPQGVSVDNYSVRSNSGMALFGTNSSINAQIGKLLGYDLVVLQYGLNAMSPDILNYNSYCAQLVRIINHVRDCFPGAAVMLMSVGDRSTRSGGEYVTMPAVRAMLAAQRSAAGQAGAAFWNTFQAMGGERSMVGFVENKWASKDYTHIGYPGGKYIGTQLVRSLVYGYRAYNGESPDVSGIPLPDYGTPAAPAPVPDATAPADTTAPAAQPAARPEATSPDTQGADHPSLPSVDLQVHRTDSTRQ